MKTRMYAVSMQALLPSQSVDVEGLDTARIEHSARIIIATSAEDAKAQVEPLVFEMWPRDKGWQDHTVVTVAPTVEFMNAVQETTIERSLSFMDDLGEGTQFFSL